MTKFAYIFGTLDLQSTCDKRVAAAHYGKPSLTLCYATPRGYAPLKSNAMVAFGNQYEPFSIVTPTRANSEGKLDVING